MLGFLIFLGVVFLIYKTLTVNQNQAGSFVSSKEASMLLQKGREELLTNHILQNIEISLSNSISSDLDDSEKGLVLYFGLEKLKLATIEASPQLSKNFSVPLYRVNQIIDEIFDRLMKSH